MCILAEYTNYMYIHSLDTSDMGITNAGEMKTLYIGEMNVLDTSKMIVILLF